MQKSFLKSRTVWGLLIAASPTIVNAVSSAFGVDLTPDDLSALVGVIETLVTAGGTLLGIYGRYEATMPIGLRSK